MGENMYSSVQSCALFFDSFKIRQTLFRLKKRKTTGSLESDRRECRKTRHKVGLRLFIRDDNVFWKRETREKSIETLVVGGEL